MAWGGARTHSTHLHLRLTLHLFHLEGQLLLHPRHLFLTLLCHRQLLGCVCILEGRRRVLILDPWSHCPS